MECVPTVNVEVVNVADPPLSVPVPSVTVPFLNVTVPVGVPEVAVTVAVNVTAWPDVEGFSEDATVVVGTGFTVCDRGAEVLAVKLASPP
jgi:hypothetical protein